VLTRQFEAARDPSGRRVTRTDVAQAKAASPARAPT
jgi:hypothetical protein